MFSDVLASLRRAEGVDAIAVVTDDAVAGSLASGDHVAVLPDERRAGQSEAAEVGIAYARTHGFERVLLVPGDTPMLDAVEVEELLERCARDEIAVAIVPDRHGTGTNALLISPPGAFTPSFGPGSLERHVATARHAEVAHRVEAVPSLALDVDTPDDLAALWGVVEASRRGAGRTRGALAQLDRAGVRAAISGGRGRETVGA